MGTTSNTLFTGNSRYAQDFQSVIDRSVAIASLPMKQHQNQLAAMQGESAELSLLTAKFTALGTALDRLTTAAGIQATSSDPSVLTATAAADAAKGTYTLDIRDVGSAATSLSAGAAILDPSVSGLSTATAFTLTVKTDPGTGAETTRTISFSTIGTSLNALRDAINSQPGLHVRATVVNVGTSTAPDYRLSIQSMDLAPESIQLNDGTSDLLTAQANGSRVTYRINGGTQDFTSDSRTLALSQGLTVDVLSAKPGTPVTVSVDDNANAISSALTNFATYYNALIDELGKNHGSGGGALTGNSVIGSLSSTLSNMMFYEGNSTSFSEIGLVMDSSNNGHITLDPALFAKASENLSQVTGFLGSSTSGFISNAQSALDSVTGLTGSLTSASDGMETELKTQNQRITDDQDRIDQLRTRLEAQMAASDALIAQLEQQANYFTSMFKAMAADTSSL
jgi:flagellar hook-associated protein 2